MKHTNFHWNVNMPLFYVFQNYVQLSHALLNEFSSKNHRKARCQTMRTC